MIKAILFDRDGVIIDSEGTNVDSTIAALSDLGIEIKQDEKELIIGRHPQVYVKDFLKIYSFSEEEFHNKQTDYYYKFFEEVKIFEDMIDLIKRLKTQGYLLALTTSSQLDSTKTILEKNNLLNLFDVIITYEDCKKKKPDAEPYILTANRLGVKSNECLVIEDTQIGLESAKNAKMKCIVIPNQYTKQQNFSKADFIINKPDEIISILENFNS